MQFYLPPTDPYQALDQYLMDKQVRRIFLVCGKSLRRLPAGAYFENLEARLGIQVVLFSDFTPNPRYEAAITGTARFLESGCDFIAAAGGGSAMDVAKCVKRFANMDLSRSCLEQDAPPSGVPLLAVPTTAGTGSEATRFAVIYDQGVKQSVAHDGCLPDAVLLDPGLLETLPDYHRKASMLDALCHAMESFWSVRASAESRDYARQAIQLLFSTADAYLQNTPVGNLGMLTAANLAGKAINLTQTTAGHAMCYGLTGRYGLAHGHAAALCVRRLWPYMLENIRKSAHPAELQNVFCGLAEAMGCASAESAIEKYDRFLRRLDLAAPAAQEADYAVLTRTVNAQRLQNNPVPLDAGDIETLYRQIL